MQAVGQQTYPAQTRSVSGKVHDVVTEVTTTNFADRIVLTISQDGRLGQWFQVALEPRDASAYAGMPQPDTVGGGGDDDDYDNSDMLPLPHLTARTLLGASTPDRETAGQLYATQIATAIMTKRPEETRSLLVGLGLKSTGELSSREQFFDLLELVTKTI